MAALTEDNIAALNPGATAPHRERKLSNVSAKSVEKALQKMGPEAMEAAMTTVVLGEKNREAGPDGRRASATKAMEQTGTAKSAAAAHTEKKAGGGCCVVM